MWEGSIPDKQVVYCKNVQPCESAGKRRRKFQTTWTECTHGKKSRQKPDNLQPSRVQAREKKRD